jgi:hypothetical protein
MDRKYGAAYISKENNRENNIAMLIWYLYFRSFSDTSIVSWIVLLLQRERDKRRKKMRKGWREEEN